MQTAKLRLPVSYSPATSHNCFRYLHDLTAFIVAPLPASLFNCHPNIVSLDDFAVPLEWADWWEWAAEADDGWVALLKRAYPESETHGSSRAIPADIQAMVDQVGLLTLPRKVATRQTYVAEAFLMKEKKAHEISQMAPFVDSVARHLQAHHIVDIGAGQGYVTKALAALPHRLDILALESNKHQIEGSDLKSQKKQRANQLTRSMKIQDKLATESVSFAELQVDENNLSVAVDNWISSGQQQADQVNCGNDRTPVILVGLHACGTLTPSVMRSFLSLGMQSNKRNWYTAGLVMVGCCYHLMERTDFPMSERGKTECHGVAFTLKHDHMMLAVQTPHLWLASPSAESAARISLQKIAFRAMLDQLLSRSPEVVAIGPSQRIYKIHNRYCTNFASYVEKAATRLHLVNGNMAVPQLLSRRPQPSEELKLMRRLRILHTLRCILGPLIESLILLDRYLYLVEGCRGCEVQLVALFDQNAGSPRNMALVVEDVNT